MNSEDKKNKEGLSPVRIYFQSWAFPWKRMQYFLIALLVAIAIILLFYYLGYRFFLEYIVEMTLLGIIVAIFVFGKIAIVKLNQYYIAHTAIITEGLVHGVIPQPCISEGLKLAKRVFTTDSFLQLFMVLVKSIFQKDLKNKDGKITNFWKELLSFIIAQLSAAIPYLSACASSWTMLHPDRDPEQTIWEGVELFRQNFKKMLGLIILYSVLILGIVVAGMIAVGNYLYNAISELSWIIWANNLLSKYGVFIEWGKRPATTIIVTAGIIFVFYIFLCFLRPVGTIGVLKKFYELVPADTGQADTGTVRLS